MKVKFTLSIGFVGARRECICDVDDNITGDELEEQWRDWADSHIDGGWVKLEDQL